MIKNETIRTKKNIWPFVTCQFLSTFNEEILRMFVSLFLLGSSHKKYACKVSSISHIAYSLPLFLLSGTAGVIADQFDRARTFLLAKRFALLSTLLTALSFYLDNPILSLLSLSVFFSHVAILIPAKYSLIPEIVPVIHIARVNSFFSIIGIVAGLIGQPLAAFLIQVTNKSFFSCSLICCLTALLEVLLSLKLQSATRDSIKMANISLSPLKNILRVFK
ncbi:MFS transporter, partial [Candidatus Similichlamydia epinepheli]|uniref:MFS transporter n=1 Tax=Candidatus Similichlamydia epinepheli TaxID=1903953 RepID=UPI0013007ECB